MAAAQTLAISNQTDITAAGLDPAIVLAPDTNGVPPIAGEQGFDLTQFPNLRAVQVHAVNGSTLALPNTTTPITFWALSATDVSGRTGPLAIAADTPDGWCYQGRINTSNYQEQLLAAQFRDATVLTGAAYTAAEGSLVNVFTQTEIHDLLAEPAAFYTINAPFWIGDGALKDYFQTNWGSMTDCQASSTPEQPADTDQRQTLYVPSGALTLFFGIVDTAYSDNYGSATVSLMLTISDDSGAAPIGGGTALNVIDNDTINGSTPVIGTSTASISQSTVDPQGNAVTWPTGVTLDTATGNIQVAATVAPGTYPVWYQLCDNTTSPASCALALATVTVRSAGAQAVPTLQGWSLCGLLALLGLGAAFAQRRRGQA